MPERAHDPKVGGSNPAPATQPDSMQILQIIVMQARAARAARVVCCIVVHSERELCEVSFEPFGKRPEGLGGAPRDAGEGEVYRWHRRRRPAGKFLPCSP